MDRKKIGDIRNLTTPEPNLEYQALIRDAVWEGILLATRDPATGQALIRNQDVFDALLTIGAMVASSADDLNSPTRIRKWSDEVAKDLRKKVADFIRARDEGNSPWDEINPATRSN